MTKKSKAKELGAKFSPNVTKTWTLSSYRNVSVASLNV